MNRLFILMIGLVLLGVEHASAVSLRFQPASLTADTGDTLSIDLVVDGLTSGGPDSVGAFDVDLLFDPSALSFLSAATGVGLGFSAEGYTTGGGVIDGFATSLESDATLDLLQGSTVTLATLSFDVLNLPAGSMTTLAINERDPLLFVSDGFGVDLPISTVSNAVVSNPLSKVPTPGILALLSIGLATLSYIRHKAK